MPCPVCVASRICPLAVSVAGRIIARLKVHSHSYFLYVGGQSSRKNSGSHIDASHSRQPLVKGERLVRYEVNAVIPCDPAQAPQPNCA